MDDVRGQLDRLVVPEFLTATPWEWLIHYPRYFRAMVLRLEKLRGGAARDRELLEQELRPREEAFEERARRQAEAGIEDPELARYRWMLEEFRVSLFAQQLGTSIPVSAKRLDRQWALVGQ